ncbi:MAG: FHA domain-containing protein [Gammaproteobacteria bacterium]|nr:FHA domain-containing protein [Gammaproteobacteria bacterium]
MSEKDVLQADSASAAELAKALDAERDKNDALTQTIAKLKRKIDDQNKRIDALAKGREEGMEAINELRAELALVAGERDRLRKELNDLDQMQTETLTLDEDDIGDETDAHQGALPSIDELMETFSGKDNAFSGRSHTTAAVERDDADLSGEWAEMISPELIVLGSGKDKVGRPLERFLVMVEPGNHVKCPLDQDLMTIGRSDSADIKIDGDFISRIHARILRLGMDTVIEDAGSKNGTRVNGDEIKRRVLDHGDLIRIGSVSFRYVDSSAADSDAE